MMLEDKIKNADRIQRANNLVIQTVQHESNRGIIEKLSTVSQLLSDIHKDCVSDFKHARHEE